MTSNEIGPETIEETAEAVRAQGFDDLADRLDAAAEAARGADV